MLIQLTELPRSGAEYAPPSREIGINPEQIGEAVPSNLPGWEGLATRIERDGEVLFVMQSVTEVIRRCNQAMQICLGQDNIETA